MNPDTSLVKNRPTEWSEEVRAAAIEYILPDVVRWLEAGGEKDPDLDDLRKQLAGSAEYYRDGYRMASSLDRNYHWEVDSELVDMLDGLHYTLSDEKKIAVWAWLKDNNIFPKLIQGANVKVKPRDSTEIIDGIITKVDLEGGQYIVRCPSLGHIEPGGTRTGTLGIYLDYAEVEDLNG